jgi:hypothetical protein
VRREIPAGTLFSVLGGHDSSSDAGKDIQVILTDSRPSAQHGEEKFQYSVRVGIDGLPGSSAGLVPRNDFPLLHRLIGERPQGSEDPDGGGVSNSRVITVRTAHVLLCPFQCASVPSLHPTGGERGRRGFQEKERTRVMETG